ncbi:hypothetical protein J6TS7_29570 [Paenibacillus dendritiformis]|uniref:CopG family transcriptional regulator n=1 Tax=Paenibacillus TaxID=44249 RepID=UPI001B0FD779|nr:CopG family transcriptional regulator [Paenibacillus dendritiformis]GIO79347.1 hypothetical protein J6TS7_29570 [Paenibacillus dendritiformis]
MKEFKQKNPKKEGQTELVLSRGGKREGAGRPSLGLENRKPTIGLPSGEWDKIDIERGNRSLAEYLREIILARK